MTSFQSKPTDAALHAAVVFENDLEAICSFDRDFDVIEGLRRHEP
jgi:predicted nucleic acid-binding protein